MKIWPQFVRQSPRYAVGFLLLAAYQFAQYWFDTRIKQAIDAVEHGQHGVASTLGFWMVIVALLAFGVRVLSRVAIFNGGRIAEYELRVALLDRLQKLGPSFYRRMSTGEIMSRVTNDLTQVRLLLGFGVLNVINTPFALVSALGGDADDLPQAHAGLARDAADPDAGHAQLFQADVSAHARKPGRDRPDERTRAVEHRRRARRALVRARAERGSSASSRPTRSTWKRACSWRACAARWARSCRRSPPAGILIVFWYGGSPDADEGARCTAAFWRSTARCRG